MENITSTLAALAKYDTPTICNAIELFGMVPPNRGYMDGRIKAAFPELPPMVGFAATAAFRSDSPPIGRDTSGNFEAHLTRFAELPGPAVAVFQVLDDPPVAATFGEGMCSIYRSFGSVGLITSGAGRDIDQIRAIKYPVFTNGSTICSHGYCHLLHVGLPVHVGGLTVNNGELLHGDVNGVTRIPTEIADQVSDVAAEYLAAEKVVLDYVNSAGTKSVRELANCRREFSSLVAKLGERIRRRI